MEEKTVVTSPKFSLNWRDLLKGLGLSVGTAVLNIVLDSLNAGDLNFDWKKIGTVAITVAVAYLVKNFFTPAMVTAPKTETEK